MLYFPRSTDPTLLVMLLHPVMVLQVFILHNPYLTCCVISSDYPKNVHIYKYTTTMCRNTHRYFYKGPHSVLFLILESVRKVSQNHEQRHKESKDLRVHTQKRSEVKVYLEYKSVVISAASGWGYVCENCNMWWRLCSNSFHTKHT